MKERVTLTYDHKREFEPSFHGFAVHLIGKIGEPDVAIHFTGPPLPYQVLHNFALRGKEEKKEPNERLWARTGGRLAECIPIGGKRG